MNRFVYYCVLGVILLLLEPPGYVSLRWSRSTSTSGAMGGLSLLFDPCDSGCQCYDQEDVQENDTMKKHFMVVCKHSNLSWWHQYEVDYVDVAQQIPSNTTNLVFWKFPSLNVGMVLFQSILHPLLMNLTIYDCMQLDLLPGALDGKMFYSIRGINISNNFMKSYKIRKETFSLLVNLREVLLIKNHVLDVIETHAFKLLPKVEVINLTGNSIVEIHQEAFYNLPQLASLDLSYNFLKTIPGEDIIQLPSLKWLAMDGNLWNCSCDMEWILLLDKSMFSSLAVCRYPPELNGTLLHQLNFTHFQQCRPIFKWGSILILAEYSGLFLLSLISGIYMRIVWKRFRRKMLVECGQIVFSTKDPLGSNVFKGKLKDGRDVAVKMISHVRKERCNELDKLLYLSKTNQFHENVVQYLLMEEDNNATYIALALYKGNLRDLLRDAVSSGDVNVLSQLTCQQCLCQITCGLAFLHKNNVQHRDIKPSNILWDVDSSGVHRFIVADLDLGRYSEEHSSNRPCYGSEGWSAPELWGTGKRTSAVDIFSLGCVFFYVLSRGGHPFASSVSNTVEELQDNIGSDHFSLESLNEHCNGSVAHMAIDVIGSMIQNHAKKRPSVVCVQQHPLFWTIDKQVDFYHKTGNRLDSKKYSIQLEQQLEQKSEEVFEGSWMERLPKAVRKDVDGFKKQKTHIRGLLRVIRDKIEHFYKLRPELKDIYNNSPEGLVHFYNSHFPKLLLYTYRVRQEAEETSSQQQASQNISPHETQSKPATL